MIDIFIIVAIVFISLILLVSAGLLLLAAIGAILERLSRPPAHWEEQKGKVKLADGTEAEATYFGPAQGVVYHTDEDGSFSVAFHLPRNPITEEDRDSLTEHIRNVSKARHPSNYRGDQQ